VAAGASGSAQIAHDVAVGIENANIAAVDNAAMHDTPLVLLRDELGFPRCFNGRSGRNRGHAAPAGVFQRRVLDFDGMRMVAAFAHVDLPSMAANAVG
jgi:hypothetical protein